MSMIRPSHTAAARTSLLVPMSATLAVSLLVLVDSLAVLIAGYVTYDSYIIYTLDDNLYLFAVLFVWLVTLSVMNFGGLYTYDVALHPVRQAGWVLAATAIAFVFFLAAAFSLKLSDTLSRAWFFAFALSSPALLLVFRLGLSALFRSLLRFDGLRRNLAVIGRGEQVRRLLQALHEKNHPPVKVSGILNDGGEADAPDRPLTETIQDLAALVDLARRGLVDDVAIALPWSEEERIMGYVAKLRELPVNVYIVNDLVGFRTSFQPAPTHFGSLPLMQVMGKPMSGWDAAIKAAEDYTLGAVLFLMLLPVLAVVALAVKLDSPGPVIFRQKRLGFNNRVFNVYKFRTMYHGATQPARTVQARKDDPRVTRIGRYLRRLSLDELPQIFNVLNGTMSLVGPRPHALDHNEEFARRMEGYFARHRVKPGITGLAQVKGYRGPTDTKEKLEGRIRNDILYAENWSLTLDLKILLRTVFIALWGRNAF